MRRPRNVLVISHLFPSAPRPADGLFVFDQVKALREECQVHVVAPIMWVPGLFRSHAKYGSYHRIPLSGSYQGVPVDYLRYFCLPGKYDLPFRGWTAFRAIRSRVRTLHRAQPFDLIHAHTAIMDGEVARRLARELGIPYVVTIHGEDFQRHIRSSRLARQVIARVGAEAAACVTVSKKLARIGQDELGLANVRTIYNGVRLTKESVFKAKSAPVVVAVGNLIETKGFDTLLRALAILHDRAVKVVCHIVGEGPAENHLRQTVVNLGLQEQVLFHGVLPNEQVQKLMQQSDLFALPSYKEAFGVVYLEAMGNGLPVIGCRGEGIGEVVEEGETGFLIDPHDHAGLAELLERLLSDDAGRRRVGEAARRLVRSTFTWERNAAEYLALYAEFMPREAEETSQ